MPKYEIKFQNTRTSYGRTIIEADSQDEAWESAQDGNYDEYIEWNMDDSDPDLETNPYDIEEITDV